MAIEEITIGEGFWRKPMKASRTRRTLVAATSAANSMFPGFCSPGRDYRRRIHLAKTGDGKKPLSRERPREPEIFGLRPLQSLRRSLRRTWGEFDRSSLHGRGKKCDFGRDGSGLVEITRDWSRSLGIGRACCRRYPEQTRPNSSSDRRRGRDMSRSGEEQVGISGNM